jgi:non-ribosomal peptide synthetase component F
LNVSIIKRRLNDNQRLQIELPEENEKKRQIKTEQSMLSQLFIEEVAKNPHHIALVFESTMLTYDELNTRANQLAHYLRDRGVGLDRLVAIACDRSIQMVIGILAILKAGGTYVPLDPTYPSERLTYMLDDSNASVLLTQSHLVDNLPYKSNVVLIDSTAYSGYPVSNAKCTVIIPTLQELSHGKFLVRLIEKHRITTFLSTPSLMHSILNNTSIDDMQNVKRIVSGGEVLSVDLLRRLQILATTHIFNLYGPTETTTVATAYKVKLHYYTNGTVPIGTPVRNMSAYILDSSGKPVPTRMTGELHIGGIGLARGYLNQPESTRKAFVVNPFASERDRIEGTNLRLYRTGDLCRLLDDGNLDYVGRQDDQVKLRGFLIQLSEIEATIKQHPHVKDSVVVLRPDNGSRLVVYLVFREQSRPT